ncbi:MAG: ATP sulfurylase [Candidatus Alkanophagales archaeon MCA70_species_1]|nr:ATP sulfurylase [Candidatus Alkanophaga volatiphilum]
MPLPKPHGGRLVNRTLSCERREAAEKEAKELPRLKLREELLSDLRNIAHGIYSPLEGFLCQDDFENVLFEKRLADDTPWTIPIILDISHEERERLELQEGDTLTLCDGSGREIALMHVESIYSYNKEEFAEKVFLTTDKAHPGVAKVYELGELLLGGEIEMFGEVEPPFSRFYLRPVETRVLFKERGWRTVAGFQTRNVPHLGHEYVQKTALTFVDGIFINPVIGKKKSGDFKDEVILAAYETLLCNYYLKENAVMSILPMEMRYAGPREAIHHAIIRKNFGCTHFIVGRDHAGVGSYYSPYAAQEIFSEFPDLGIVPVFFKSFFYCRKCMTVVNEKICPHGEEFRISFSGTKIREMLLRGEVPPPEIMRPEVAEVVKRWENPFVS